MGTESLYIYANYDYSGEEERIVGYTATNTLSISTAQLDQLGSYIDAAFAAGANTLDNVRFFAQDTQSAQQEALTLAVQNAREKAETIAAASGMKLGGIVSIDENQNHYGYDATAKYSNARAEDTVAAGATMVQASTLQVSASVVMEFMLTEGE